MAQLVVQTRKTFVYAMYVDPEASCVESSHRRAESCPPEQTKRCDEEGHQAKGYPKIVSKLSDASDTESEGTRTPSSRASCADIFQDSEDMPDTRRSSNESIGFGRQASSETEPEGANTPSSRASWADISDDDSQIVPHILLNRLASKATQTQNNSPTSASSHREASPCGKGVRSSHHAGAAARSLQRAQGDCPARGANCAIASFEQPQSVKAEAAEQGATNSAVVLVMQNIPSRATASDLARIVEARGYTGHFEYIYLPCKPKSGQNRGYAFAGFTSAAEAHAFTVTMHGSCFPGRTSNKSLVVEPAASRTGISEKHLQAMRTTAMQTKWGPILDGLGEIRAA